jgi:hypothetical protein
VFVFSLTFLVFGPARRLLIRYPRREENFLTRAFVLETQAAGVALTRRHVPP